MYMVPHRTPAPRAARTPCMGLVPGVCVPEEAMARMAAPTHKTSVPPKTPTTMTSEMTIGERPSVTSLVGASAAPSQAPAVSPEKIPRSCREREREESVEAAVGGADIVRESTLEGAARQGERLREPRIG